MKEIYDFLKEYESLCQKHGLCFDGCNCCDNPYLTNFYGERFEELDKEYFINNIKFYRGVLELEYDNYRGQKTEHFSGNLEEFKEKYVDKEVK